MIRVFLLEILTNTASMSGIVNSIALCLNKVAKQLMFQYCPFAETIRRKLEANAMYASMIHRHEAKAEKQFKVLTSKYRKYRKDTETLPQEIENYIAYYKR